MTYAEQLASVQTAIAMIESGAQSYTIGGRSLSRADLGTLYAREKYLRAMAAREEISSDGYAGIRVRRAVPQD